MYSIYSVEELEMINAIIHEVGEDMSFEDALFAYYSINGEDSSLY